MSRVEQVNMQLSQALEEMQVTQCKSDWDTHGVRLWFLTVPFAAAAGPSSAAERVVQLQHENQQLEQQVRLLSAEVQSLSRRLGK